MIEWEYDDYRQQNYAVVACDYCREYENTFFKYEGYFICKNCLVEQVVRDKVAYELTPAQVLEECE